MSFRASERITIWIYSIKIDLSNIKLLTKENHMNEMSRRLMNLSLVRKKIERIGKEGNEDPC